MPASREGSEDGDEDAAGGADDDDDPGWEFPGDKEHEADHGEGERGGACDRGGEHRGVEGGGEDADDGGAGAAHDGLRPGVSAEGVPEREHADQEEEAGQED